MPYGDSENGGHFVTGRKSRLCPSSGVLSARYTFQCTSDDHRRPLPQRLTFGLGAHESQTHVVLKLIAWLLFYRERLSVDTDLQNDSIPFVPDVCQLGYDLRPLLWVECGDCSVAKLHKLASKCADAELWIVKSSRADADQLLRLMAREKLRRDRYHLLALDPDMVSELTGLLRERNTVHWHSGGFEPPQLQWVFNDVWVEATFELLQF